MHWALVMRRSAVARVPPRTRPAGRAGAQVVGPKLGPELMRTVPVAPKSAPAMRTLAAGFPLLPA
jgi:hypothetical protein